jgi:hexosaminidase
VLRLADGATLAVPAGDVPARAAATLLAARLAAQHGLTLRVVEGDVGTVRSCAARWRERRVEAHAPPWRRAARLSRRRAITACSMAR